MNSKNEEGQQASDPRIGFFDCHAATWDSNGPKATDTLQRLKKLRDLLGLHEGENLLEVGCGTGQITAWLGESVRPGRVTAIDFSEAMLEQARKKQIEADFRCLDVCLDKLGTQVYEVILCFHSFPHFRNQNAALANMSQALKPGGRLVVMHLADRRHINALHDGVGGAVAGDHLPDQESWLRMLAAAGLDMTRWIEQDDLFVVQAEPS
ncbi:MAG: methyltransferase domain-containing protein [Phycisphaerales bacterium]|nr:methyltransferase domain-containing protein [Phycisphaerales bacterium]